MRKVIISMIAMLGLATACAQQASRSDAVAENNADNSTVTDTFMTKSGKKVAIYPLVHASMRIVYGDKEIMVDPVTSLNGRKFDFATMPKADIILLTHEHHDHFDAKAISALSDNDTRLIANKKCAEAYGAGEVMANGDSLRLADDISVKAVAAYNTTKGHQQFHPKGNGNGYILNLDGLIIYIAGDTEDIPEMSELGEMGIDVAFLPCNQPYTMTPDQLIRVAKIIKPKVLYPYHFGDTDLSKIPTSLSGTGIDVRIRKF